VIYAEILCIFAKHDLPHGFTHLCLQHRHLIDIRQYITLSRQETLTTDC